MQNLGKKVIAAIVKKDVRTIQRWLSAKTTIAMEEERILRDVFQVYTMLSEADDPHVARAWFLGMNPHLSDASPIDALIAGKSRSVVAAARVFVNGA